MKIFKNKKDNTNIICTTNRQLLDYLLENNVSIDDIEFTFEDGYNEQNWMN